MADSKKERLRKRILEEEDFIYSPRHANSLKKLVEMNPDGIEDEKISKILLIGQKDLQDIWNSVITKLKQKLGGS